MPSTPFLRILFCCIGLFTISSSYADSAVSNAPENQWGIAFGLRTADIPYVSDTSRVNDIVPLFFYQGERFYLDGLSFGYRVWKTPEYDLSLTTRYRFVDIPAQYQNRIRGNGVDVGGRFNWYIDHKYRLGFELLTDDDSNLHSNLLLNRWSSHNRWLLEPYGQIRLKSEGYNTRYFALEQLDAPADIDLKVGLKARYHVWKEFNLVGHIGGTIFGKNTYDLPTIDQRHQLETYIGISFFGEQFKSDSGSRTPGFFRIAHDWATPSNLSSIIRFESEKDEYNNQLTSFMYGHLLSETLLTLPIELYFTPGLAYHHSSEVQSSFAEYFMAIKGYYTIRWPTTWRIGVSEGLSYSTEINYIEATEMEEKGYEPSNLMNYLGFSIDLNVGELFNSQDLKPLWFGYNIHHRSSIFESSSLFGRIKGGSNYQGLHFQWHW